MSFIIRKEFAMPKAFTSGENTADIQAERKINGNGLWIFAAILAAGLILFGIFAMTYTADKLPPSANTIENTRAQP